MSKEDPDAGPPEGDESLVFGDPSGWAHMIQLALAPSVPPRGVETPPDAEPGAAQQGASSRYTVIEKLGQGGMGEVVEVVDTYMQRPVALKRMIGERGLEHQFLREARTTGRLDHPNIVPVHDLGVDGEGRAFYTVTTPGSSTGVAASPSSSSTWRAICRSASYASPSWTSLKLPS